MIVLPARNEGPRVGSIARAVRHAMPHVPSWSWRTAPTTTPPRAPAPRRPLPRSDAGYARALRTGFRHALDHGARWVVQMDADGQHPADAVPGLLRALDTADSVIGSRFHGDAGYHVPLHRRVAIGALAAWASVFAGQRLFDVTSGLRAWRAPALALAFDDPQDIADANVLVRAVRRGLRVREVPVAMRARIPAPPCTTRLAAPCSRCAWPRSRPRKGGGADEPLVARAAVRSLVPHVPPSATSSSSGSRTPASSRPPTPSGASWPPPCSNVAATTGARPAFGFADTHGHTLHLCASRVAPPSSRDASPQRSARGSPSPFGSPP